MIETVTASLPENAGFETGLPILVPLKKQVGDAGEFLWPSEKTRQMQLLTGRLGALAMSKAEAEFNRVTASSEPTEKLKGLTALATSNGDYRAYLLPSDAEALEKHIAAEQARIADTLIGPTMTAIDELEPGVAGLKRLELLRQEIQPVVALLRPGAAKNYEAKIEAKRTSMLTGLMSGRLAVLKSVKPGRDGLRESSAWLTKFRTDLAGLENEPLYKNAIGQFFKERQSLLQRGLGNFKSDLTQLGPSASATDIDALLNDYLSSKSDLKLPVSLGYLIIAETAKASH